VLHSFNLDSTPGGGIPDGRLIETSPGVFIGTTQLGATVNPPSVGVVFELTLASATSTGLSVVPSSTVFGQNLTLTASVTSASGTPTGQVQFFHGTTSLGTVSLSGGTAALTTAALGIGIHTLSATYSGDSGFMASTSPDQSVTVAKAQTATSLSSTPNPSTRKQVATVTASVAAVAPGSGTPTGQVSFLEGKKKLGTATLVNGIASLQIAFNMGSHVVTATYVGNANFVGSTAAPLTQTVDR